MSKPSAERNSTMPLPAFFVGRWLLAEQPEILMQWFAVIGLFRGTCAERRETSLGFMLGQATQRHRHLSTMFHVTTQHRGKQHTRLRTIFWFTKSCPSGLLCVCGKPWIKGYQQGGNSPSSYVAQRSYGRCGGRVHGRMNLYLLSVWDPANPRTGLPLIMSCHAFSRVGNKVMLHTW